MISVFIFHQDDGGDHGSQKCEETAESDVSSEVDDSYKDSDYVPDSDSDESVIIDYQLPMLALKKNTSTTNLLNENKAPGTSSTTSSLAQSNDHDDDKSHAKAATQNSTDLSTTYTVMSTNNNSSRVYDKKFYCLYCDKAQSKLPRHLRTHHSNEKEVQMYMAEKDETARNNLLTKLRNLGNHHHNIGVIRSNTGSLVVKYRPKDHSIQQEYLPCEYCYAYYISSDLWKHVKRCKLAPSSSKPRRVVKSSRLLLPVSKEVSKGLQSVLASLNADEVSRIVKSDALILKVGEKQFGRHGHDNEQYSMIRNNLRELGRLLKQLRQTSGKINATLESFLDPAQFKTVVNAAKAVAGFSEKENSFKTPSLALKLGHSLKKCCKILEGQALETGNEDLLKRSTAFHKLCEMNWSDEVSTHALRTLAGNKRNKVKLIPLTSDVKLLTDYLKTKGKEAYEALDVNNRNFTAWSDLNQITLSQLMLFNRRRQGEVSKMKLSDFEGQHSGIEEDITETLSPLEQHLCQVLKRIEIVGKRGRTVPVILTQEVKMWLDLLIKTRENVGVNVNNQFIFARPYYGSLGHIRGSDCLRDFSEDCGATHPKLLRSTKLRFQIATLSQILNMKENELDLLADFLGHDIRVHREFYRLPEHTLQVAKVSKLLLALESGQITQQAGRGLEEITIDAEEGKYKYFFVLFHY